MDNDWKKKLTPEQYRVMREKGTEMPFSGEYVHTKEEGMYRCAACGAELFSSDTKFESAMPGLLGWPSFNQSIPGSIEYREDKSQGMNRTEVVCAKCKSHLGHIFDDPESETGKHLCINSVCLDLKKK